MVRVDFERVECPKCGERFVPGAGKSRWSAAVRREPEDLIAGASVQWAEAIVKKSTHGLGSPMRQ